MRNKILIFAYLVPCMASAPVTHAEQEVLQERLDAAVATYNGTVEKNTSQLLEYIRGKVADAQRRGDLDLKKSFEAAQDSLQRGELPTLPLLRGVVEQSKRDLARAKNRLLAEYRDVEREYVKQANDRRAEAVRSESQELDSQLDEKAIGTTRRPRPKAVIPKIAIKWDKNGHHYLFIATPGSISWSEAQQRCRDAGGYLACGETQEELEFLYSLRAGKRAWLGGRDVEGRWVWTTGGRAPVPAGKGGNNKFLATTRQAGAGGRIAQPDVAGFVDGYLCEWEE